MRYKAVLLDYYGTLVGEDDAIIARIVRRIAEASPVNCAPDAVLRDWRFGELCDLAHGENFKTQRQIEQESLAALLQLYNVGLDPAGLSEELWRHWQAPEVFDDAAWFLQQIDVPTCVVSNIDTEDLDLAISNAGWSFDHVVTSEMCRAYKPRQEVFARGLSAVGCRPDEVLHVGDSLRVDMAGAQNAGIDAAWINRKGRPIPTGAPAPDFEAPDLRGLFSMLAR
jgi:2-haloalkanoic acid dehalogenase type II